MTTQTHDVAHPLFRPDAGRARRERFLLRVRVTLRRHALDRALIGGADPTASLELALRAGQVVSQDARASLAGHIEHAANSVDRVSHARSPQIPMLRDELRMARPALLQLAGLLRSTRYPNAQGVLEARRLLVDGSSSLYVRGERGDAARTAMAAADALLLAPQPA